MESWDGMEMYLMFSTLRSSKNDSSNSPIWLVQDTQHVIELAREPSQPVESINEFSMKIN